MTLESKFKKLKNSLREMKSIIIAFSGGVDSTFLLKAASISGAGKVLAVTGYSESIPSEEFAFSKEITKELAIEHKIITTHEIENKDYAKNPPDRCYYCKKELFTRLRTIAVEQGYTHILDGTNSDDAGDWRPGRRAAAEEGVFSPLLDHELSKNEIRELSRMLGLPTWNKPATPCLSSRFPYGQQITVESLKRVDRAEIFIRKYGLREFRVRSHSDLARIEASPEDFNTIMSDQARQEIVNYLKSIGFMHVTIDLQGFRSGSSNELFKNHPGPQEK